MHTLYICIFTELDRTCIRQNHGYNAHVCVAPGSLSRVVMNAVLGEIISTASGWSVEVNTTTKYSDSSVVLSSMVGNVRVADI